MTKTRFFATALTLAMLSGCTATAAGQITPGAPNQPGATASKTNAGAANSTELAAAMTEEREAEGYGYLAADGAAQYAVQMVGAEKPPEGMMGITANLGGDVDADVKPVKAGVKLRAKIKADVKAKLDARKSKLQVRFAKLGEKLGKAKDRVKDAFGKAAWTENEDGTKTKKASFKVEKTIGGKAAERDCTHERTLDADGELVKATWSFNHAGPNGTKHTMTRTKDLQEDGSYKVVYHSEIVLGNGASRVRDWTKTISADGQVSGAGTIVWKDKDGKVVKTINVTFSGTDEAEKAAAVDATTNTTATVTVPADGTVTAEVKDETGATSAVTVTESADGTVEASTEG